jgi:hypothetical protein
MKPETQQYPQDGTRRPPVYVPPQEWDDMERRRYPGRTPPVTEGEPHGGYRPSPPPTYPDPHGELTEPPEEPPILTRPRPKKPCGDPTPTYDYPEKPRDSYPEKPRDSYPEKPRDSYPYPEKPREPCPETPRDPYPQKPRDSYPEKPRDSYPYPEKPREPYPETPRDPYPQKPRDSYPEKPGDECGDESRDPYEPSTKGHGLGHDDHSDPGGHGDHGDHEHPTDGEPAEGEASNPFGAAMARQNLRNLTPDARRALHERLRFYIDESGADPVGDHLRNGHVHGTPNFLPWHRRFLSRFEDWQRTQLADPTAFIPLAFWDPAEPIPSEFPHQGRTGPTGPWRLPASLALSQLAGLDYRTFSSEVERFHNDVHNAIGGDMFDPRTAPNDTCFWLLHSYVDNLFAEWEALRG